MIYDSYSIKKHGSVNCMNLATESPMSFEYKGITLPTLDPDTFDKHSPGYLRELFDIQRKLMEKLINIQIQYQCISQIEADRTRKQYADLYFYEKDGKYFCFEKERILEKSVRESNRDKVVTSRDVAKSLLEFESEKFMSEKPIHRRPKYSNENDDTKGMSEEEVDTFFDDKFDPRPKFSAGTNIYIKGSPIINFLPDGAIGVSVQGIRDITGYSWRIKMPWHSEYVEIMWQRRMMQSQVNVLVIDGSRQGGKSMGIAEKTLEESFIPGADMMVAGYMQETTENIWDYMLDYIENFDDGDFEIKERKRYIQNNKSGVRVHFRTLMNGAKGIRGKTLRYIVIDEAMLVSNDIIESIILPTQTTIMDPRLILLGTASEDTSCYMYRCIMDIEKNNTYNGPGQFTAEYIKFSIEENPLASPMKLQYVRDKKSDPKIMREYYNKWGKLEDSLFQPTPVPFSTLRTNKQAWLILASDPARKKDRSGYGLLQCMDGKITLLESGEVPLDSKGSWNMQGHFFLKLRKRYMAYDNFIMVGDMTGVGDSVFEIFGGLGLPVKYLCQYTAGDYVSEKSGKDEEIKVWTVGKSVLINNLVDLFGEKNLIILEESNKLLLGELERIQATMTRTGKISFKTPFYDDITNAVMVGAFFAKKMGYIDRITSVKTEVNDYFKKELALYSRPKKTGGSKIF